MHKVTVFYTRLLIILSFVLFPFVYFFIWSRKKDKKYDENLKILIIPQLTRIGDLVCSTPVFRAIKNKYPNSKLSVIVSAKASGIIKENPNIDELIIVEKYQNNFLGLIGKIQKEKFDFGVSLSGTALSSVLFFYGLIPARIKIMRNDRPMAEWLSDWMCNIKNKYKNLSYLPEFYVKMLKPLGIENVEIKKEVFWSKASEDKIRKFFENNNISHLDKVVGISLTAGNKVKEWGDEKFGIVAKEIVKKYGMKILFIGGPADIDRIEKLTDSLGGGDSYINGAGFLLEDLPAQMNRLDLFISVDTGPIHIAEALHKPLIDILGPVNDIELTPRGDNVRIIKPPTDIPPTVFAFRKEGDLQTTKKSLESIGVDDVVGAVESILK